MAKNANNHGVSNGSWRLRGYFNSLLTLLMAFAIVLILSATFMNVDQLQTVVLFDIRSIYLAKNFDVAAIPENSGEAIEAENSGILESSGEQPKHSSTTVTAVDHDKQPSTIISVNDGGIAQSPSAVEANNIESSSEQPKNSSATIAAGDDVKPGIAPSPAAANALSLSGVSKENSIATGSMAKNLTSIVATENVVHEEGDETCDVFEGKWVYDEASRPLYSGHGCSYIYNEVACDRYGRNNTGYQHWRWQPNACNLTRFNATKMLERIEGKRMVFVGDSVNRNQWMSMVCLLESSIPADHKILENHGSLISFKAKDYNASIDFYWAPLLVESNCDNPIYHRGLDRTIFPDLIEKHAREWEDADILIFYSYLWWKQPKIMFNLTGSSAEPNGTMITEVDNLEAYERALKTWSDWLQFHMDSPKKQLFFVSLASTHIWGQDWGTGNCYNETEPIYKEGRRVTDMDIAIMKKAEAAIKSLRDGGVYVQLLNITHMTEYRKDGHPSIYRKYWGNLTEEQIADPQSYSDCIHWCLPGVPDVWNEILYAYIFPQKHKYKTSI